MVEKVNKTMVKVTGRIDSNNAAELEKELFDALRVADGNIIIDAAGLEYVSSAGLRVFLKLKKSMSGDVSVINVTPDVYDIFAVTGFNNIITVKKALREIDITGCEMIGQGGNGSVYRIDEDKIVKVYRPTVELEQIDKEREFTKNALINGVPCVIAYDVVRCGDSYGIVFEMLKSDTLGHAFRKNPDRIDELVDKYVAFAKELHSTEILDGSITNIKEVLHKRVPNLAKWCTAEEMELLNSLIDELPDAFTLIHGDLHPGNIMIQDGELVLIDMPEVTVGPKIWDLVGIYRDMISAPSAPNGTSAIETSTGMSKNLIIDVGYKFFEGYTGIKDREQLDEYLKPLELVHALNVVLIVGAGSERAIQSAPLIMDILLRGVVIPNEQALRHILKEG
ncbi:MAG: anti-sigma factor antagonist [Clostridia bacterium]|nr:anti-sigma factor antagonist [Clostridia bacterium]